MNRIFVILALLVATLTGFAQVTLQIQAPGQVECGQRFQVRYTVNTQDVDDFRVGEFQGCQVLYGPSTSSQSSYSIVNGRTSSSSSITYTYTLLAEKEGTFTVPAGQVRSAGKTIKSNTATLQILPGNYSGGGASQSQQGGGHVSQPSRRTSSGTNISKDDLFITATASRKQVFEQEAVVVTYKLYTLVNLRQLAGEMPELDNCHVQELDNKAQMSLKYERYNGRNYGTAVWRQYVIFPQKTGKITIPSVNFDAEVEIINTSADPFDIFFGGGQMAQMVKRTITTPALEIDVKALPEPRPVGFSGAVGKFTISGTLAPSQVKANDAATLHLTISGQGNMKLMKAPLVEFPKDFEAYDPKENNNTSMSAAGAKGSVKFDYLVVPRHGGKYSIPPVQFTYFDPDAKSYKTISTDSFHLAVEKGAATRTSVVQNKEDLKVLSSDIHYIKTTPEVTMHQHRINLFGTVRYLCYYAGLLLVFIIGLFAFHQQAKANADIARRRGKRAGKAANKRLKTAAKLLKEHNSGAFFDETLRALMGFAGDKLNLSTSDLNKENVGKAMMHSGVEQSIIDRFMQVLGDCEFARFAPGDPEATMDKIFRDATEVINELDK